MARVAVVRFGVAGEIGGAGGGIGGADCGVGGVIDAGRVTAREGDKVIGFLKKIV